MTSLEFDKKGKAIISSESTTDFTIENANPSKAKSLFFEQGAINIEYEKLGTNLRITNSIDVGNIQTILFKDYFIEDNNGRYTTKFSSLRIQDNVGNNDPLIDEIDGIHLFTNLFGKNDVITKGKLSTISGTMFNDKIDVSDYTAKGVTINSGTGDDTIIGTDNNDIIYVNSDSNEITAGKGADTIYTTKNNQYCTFIIKKGDSPLTNEDKIYYATLFDTVEFETAGTVTYTKEGKNLKIRNTYGDESVDEVTLVDYYKQGVTDVPNVKNGSSSEDSLEDEAYLYQSGKGIAGTKYNDVLVGSAAADTIKGLEGDNHITGGQGNDKLYGGSETNTFYFNEKEANKKGGDVGFGNDILYVDANSTQNKLVFSDTDKLTYDFKGADVVITETKLPTLYTDSTGTKFSVNPDTTYNTEVTAGTLYYKNDTKEYKYSNVDITPTGYTRWSNEEMYIKKDAMTVNKVKSSSKVADIVSSVTVKNYFENSDNALTVGNVDLKQIGNNPVYPYGNKITFEHTGKKQVGLSGKTIDNGFSNYVVDNFKSDSGTNTMSGGIGINNYDFTDGIGKDTVNINGIENNLEFDADVTFAKSKSGNDLEINAGGGVGATLWVKTYEGHKIYSTTAKAGFTQINMSEYCYYKDEGGWAEFVKSPAGAVPVSSLKIAIFNGEDSFITAYDGPIYPGFSPLTISTASANKVTLANYLNKTDINDVQGKVNVKDVDLLHTLNNDSSLTDDDRSDSTKYKKKQTIAGNVLNNNIVGTKLNDTISTGASTNLSEVSGTFYQDSNKSIITEERYNSLTDEVKATYSQVEETVYKYTTSTNTVYYTTSNGDIINAGGGNDTINITGNGKKVINILDSDGNDTIVGAINADEIDINFYKNEIGGAYTDGTITYTRDKKNNLVITKIYQDETQKYTDKVYLTSKGILTTSAGKNTDISTLEHLYKLDGKYYKAEQLTSEQIASAEDVISSNFYLVGKNILTELTATTTLTGYFNGNDAANVVINGSSENILATLNQVAYKDADYRKMGDETSGKKQTVNGNFLNNELYGGSNNDTISTSSGDDVITANKGNDTINITGAGAKTINISNLDGNDTITGINTQGAGAKLVFDEDARISYSQGKSKNDLVLTRTYDVDNEIVDTSITKVYLKNGQFTTSKNGAEQIIIDNDNTNLYEKDGEYYVLGESDDKVGYTEITALYKNGKVFTSDETHEVSNTTTLKDYYKETGVVDTTETTIKVTPNAKNEVLIGGTGKNIYEFEAPDKIGHVTIQSVLNPEKAKDVIYVKEINESWDSYKNSSNEYIKYTRSDNDLIITFDENNTITVKDYITNEAPEGFEYHSYNGPLKYAYGSLGDYCEEELHKNVYYLGIKQNYSSSNEDLTVNGYYLNDEIITGSGNDTIWGYGDDDKIYGGSGNDKLYGNDGNDTITDGVGNDTIDGGHGSDTVYIKDTDLSQYNISVKDNGIQNSYYTENNDSIIFTKSDSEITSKSIADSMKILFNVTQDSSSGVQIGETGYYMSSELLFLDSTFDSSNSGDMLTANSSKNTITLKKGLTSSGIENYKADGSGTDYKISSEKIDAIASSVANWLSTANSGEGYDSVADAFANNDSELSTLIGIYNQGGAGDTHNAWQAVS